MPHKKKPGATAIATGDNNIKSPTYLAVNDSFYKPELPFAVVKNLRKQALRQRFFLSETQLNWLCENAFGRVANDH